MLVFCQFTFISKTGYHNLAHIAFRSTYVLFVAARKRCYLLIHDQLCRGLMIYVLICGLLLMMALINVSVRYILWKQCVITPRFPEMRSQPLSLLPDLNN